MAYMAAPALLEARADSEAVARGAQSIVCVALAYDHRDLEPSDDELRGRVARYARGADYHNVIKVRLAELADELAELCDAAFVARPVSDTAPLLERAVAERAGVGFVGKNTMLISPGLGSYTLLGELLTTSEIAATKPLHSDGRCGECRACIDACPTDALPGPFALDATRCISYLTIENRASIPKGLRRAVGNMVFGCDICQDVCPYNLAAPARNVPDPALSPANSEAGRPRLFDLARLRSSQWKRLSDKSSIRRATRRGMIRNAAVALGNSREPNAIAVLAELLADDSDVVVEHAAWALVEIANGQLAHDRRSPPNTIEGEGVWGERRSPPNTIEGEGVWGERRSPPNTIKLRDYREDDWPALCEIHDLARILELEASGLVAAFLTLEVTAVPEGLFAGRLRVAVQASRVLGFAAVAEQEINWLYVHPGAHRRGIGRRLLADAIEITGRPAEIEVLAENEAAISFYGSAGFTTIEARSGKLQGNEAFPARGLRMRLE